MANAPKLSSDPLLRLPTLALASNWWAFALRGLAAIAFGLFAFFAPGLTVLGLVLAFGAYALVDGISNLVLALRRARAKQRWGSLALAGVLGIAAAVVAVLWPGLSALGLLFVIAAWAVVLGVTQIVAAIKLRKAIRGEWMLALIGVLAVAFGVLCFLFPGAGALAVVTWIGAFAIVSGGLMIGLGIKLRSLSVEDRTRAPTGGIPTPV